MGLSFHERMAGELSTESETRAIDFELKAEAGALLRFAQDGKTRVSGVLHARPWAEAAVIDGTLEISLLVSRRIRYQLHFTGDDDRALVFSGMKRIRWLRPLYSFTHLDGTLSTASGEVLARGQLRFDLDELLPFFLSWRATSALARRPLTKPVDDAPPPFSGSLSERERGILIAAAEGLVVPGQHVQGVGPETIEGLLSYLQLFPGVVLTGYRVALRGLDTAARVRTGHSLARLPLAKRRALLARLAEGQSPGGAEGLIVHLVGAPIKMVHFSNFEHPEARRPITPVAEEPEARHMAQVVEAEALDPESEIEAEVAVVGTGAGGAALAKELAERGVAVAMVEEGRFHGRRDFVGTPFQQVKRLWRDSGITFALGTPPLVLPLGRGVGGTTTINSGTCLRAPPDVLRQWWRDEGFPSDFLPDQFARYYEAVEAELEVTPAEMQWVGKIGEVMARGADAMGLPHAPLPRNAPHCDGQAACIFGCPTSAKRSTDVSYIPKALRAGAALYTGLAVRRILMRNGRVVALEARGPDRHGRAKTLRIRAERFVLSCGTVLTPAVLSDNGIHLPMQGKNLSVHPGVGVMARFDEDMRSAWSIPQGYGVGGFEDDDIHFEGFYLPPGLLPAMIPLSGEALTEWMDDFPRVGQFGFMVKDRGVGSVRRGPDGRPMVVYSASSEALRRCRRGISILSEIMLRGGAREVLTCVAGVPPSRTIDEARAFEQQRIAASRLSLLAAHPLGTCRMGPSPETGVVDFNHLVYGTQNLHIADGSSVPTALGVNPQMTIMAMATRLAEILATEF